MSAWPRSKMNIEVELKFRVTEANDLVRRLREYGSALPPPETQVDRYFAHPARDFAQTDEALRIRQIGQKNFVTYKGPKLDSSTKSRRELEIPLPSGDAGATQFAELLGALGFREVREVRKQRRKAVLLWQSRPVEVVLDEVEGLGCFAEIETQASEADFEPARSAILALAAELGLDQPERRSYLEMLLDT